MCCSLRFSIVQRTTLSRKAGVICFVVSLCVQCGQAASRESLTGLHKLAKGRMCGAGGPALRVTAGRDPGPVAQAIPGRRPTQRAGKAVSPGYRDLAQQPACQGEHQLMLSRCTACDPGLSGFHIHCLHAVLQQQVQWLLFAVSRPITVCFLLLSWRDGHFTFVQ